MTALYDQDLIDVDTGIYFNGSRRTYKNNLKTFYDTIDKKINDISGLYSEGKTEDYTIKVHSLKSTLKTIGATGLGDEAQMIEDACKNGDPDYVASHHDDFVKKVLSLKDIIVKVLNTDEKKRQSLPMAGRDMMAGVFDEIYHAAEELDSYRLDGIFSRMEAYSIPEKDMPLFEKLKSAYNEFDYDMIIKELDLTK